VSRTRPRPRAQKIGLERSRDQDRGLEDYKTDYNRSRDQDRGLEDYKTDYN